MEEVVKEEAYEIAQSGNREKDAFVSKCPGCGANLTYAAEKECLECSHCGTEVKFVFAPSRKFEFARLLEPTNRWTDTHIFECDNCGAKQILASTEIAKTCAFCGTTNIVQKDELSGIKPNAVLPFKLTKETAINRYKNWVKKKFFAPGKFKKTVDPHNVDGVYNPTFTFDSNTFTQYTGRLGKVVTYTVTVNGRTEMRTRTEYINISGSYNGSYQDILIQASTTITQKDINALQPFNCTESKDYDENFIHGYSANQYSKDGTVCWQEARLVIDARIKSAILARYPGYTIVAAFDARTNYNDILYRYMLVPIYVGHTVYGKVTDKKTKEKKDKIYNFFVNGTNGKVTGKTPVSVGKVFGVIGIILAIVAVAAVLVAKFVFKAF